MAGPQRSARGRPFPISEIASPARIPRLPSAVSPPLVNHLILENYEPRPVRRRNRRAAGLAAWSVETRGRAEQQATRRQYLCRAIFQYRDAVDVVGENRRHWVLQASSGYFLAW